MDPKKDEILWVVDEFPSDLEDLEAEGNLSPVCISSTSIDTSIASHRPFEVVSDSSNPPVVTSGLPHLAVPDPAVVSFSQDPPRTTPTRTNDGSSTPEQLARRLVRGERLELKSLLVGEPPITFELLGPRPGEVKFICLGLDEDERLAGPEYCVGPRQPTSPCGGIHYQETVSGGHSIILCLASLPNNIRRLEFSAVAAATGGSVGKGVTGLRIGTSNGTVESTDLSSDCASSACVTLVEVYERKGEWRLRIICEVLATSVDELLKNHGASRGGSK